MKTIITVTICVVLLVAGCANYDPNPEATKIQTEWNMLLRETSELQPIVKDWMEHHTQFLASLTDDQLEAYSEWRSASAADEATTLIKLRKLRDVLSEDELQTLLALVEESAYGWYPKLQELVNRQQRLEKQWEVARQNARYSEWRQTQNQRMWQQYYQQQQLQQSLSGIENAIRNQNSGITVIPYSPATNPYIYFRDGLMQGLGLPPPPP